MQILKKKLVFIAEISANHDGQLNNVFKLIDDAKKNDADLIKLQTFKPENMTINSSKKEFLVKDGIWKNQKLYDLYAKGQTPYKWHKKIFKYSKKKKIQCFSTPFHEDDVDFLETLKTPLYKVASFELNHIPLIKKIAKTQKPIIISTGMAKLNEIELAYKTAKRYGAKEIILLYCVSNYPAKDSDFNLNNIEFLIKKFNCRVGLSDHSNNTEIAKAAIAAGATVIEKHIALRNNTKSLDYKFSLKDKEIKYFINSLKNVVSLMGKKNFFRPKSEYKNRKFRRSIFASQDIQKGEKFSRKNLKILRPSIGLEPLFFDKILGQKSRFNVKKNSPIRKTLIRKIKLIKT